MKTSLIRTLALGTALSFWFGIAGTAQAQAPARLKLGWLAATSGPLNLIGGEQRRGFDVAMEELGNRLGGIPIDVVIGDSKGNPGATVQEVSRLIEKDKVDLITGISASHELLAGVKPISDAKVFFVGSNGGPAGLAGEQCSPYYFNASFQNEQITDGIGAHMSKAGVKKLYLLAMDYEAGHEHSAAARKGYTGEVAGHVFTPIAQVDFAADIAKVRASGADAVWGFYPGAPGIAFVRQWAQAGLTGKVKLYSNIALSEPLVFPAQGKTAIGIVVTGHYFASIDNPENKKFVAAFRAKYNRDPASYAANQYDAVKLLDAAVRDVKGNIKDQDAFRAALRKASFRSVRGAFRFNQNHQPIQNAYLGVVEEGSNGLFIKMQETIVEAMRDAYQAKCAMKW